MVNSIAPKVQTLAPVSRRPRSIWTAVVLLLAAALVYFYLVKPKAAKLASLQGQAADLQSQDSSLELTSQKLKDLVEKLKAGQGDFGFLDQALPLDARVTSVNVLLETLSRASGLTLADVTPQLSEQTTVAGNAALLEKPFAASRELQSFIISASFTGNLDQMISFLKLLETNLRLVDVVSLETTAGKAGLASFRLSLKTYAYLPKPAAPSQR